MIVNSTALPWRIPPSQWWSSTTQLVRLWSTQARRPQSSDLITQAVSSSIISPKGMQIYIERQLIWGVFVWIWNDIAKKNHKLDSSRRNYCSHIHVMDRIYWSFLVFTRIFQIKKKFRYGLKQFQSLLSNSNSLELWFCFIYRNGQYSIIHEFIYRDYCNFALDELSSDHRFAGLQSLGEECEHISYYRLMANAIRPWAESWPTSSESYTNRVS